MHHQQRHELALQIYANLSVNYKLTAISYMQIYDVIAKIMKQASIRLENRNLSTSIKTGIVGGNEVEPSGDI